MDTQTITANGDYTLTDGSTGSNVRNTESTVVLVLENSASATFAFGCGVRQQATACP